VTAAHAPATAPPRVDHRELPVRMDAKECAAAVAAAYLATRLYPGPAGEVLAEELNAYAEFGWRFGAQSQKRRLIRWLFEERDRRNQTGAAAEAARAALELARLRSALRAVHAALDTRDGQRPMWQILDEIETATDHLHNPIGMEDHT
jgi:hypothetical protein